MKNVTARLGQYVLKGYVLTIMALAILAVPIVAIAAPYADMVIDARTGEVLHETNADTRLHPASLTKMMTLYIAFEAIEHGEISLDQKVTVSQNAAAEPPSKLGLKAGQKIALRYLIRAAAVKSANDAATAIGEAIGGSESAFAARMNRTAKALGMTRTTFRNANGLTAEGHMSTARDMTTLGRRLFFDYPQYYNLFSRRSADAGMKHVNSTNRRFLDSYKGADGIKTGYTTPAGFNLVASAERGDKRIIATVFGGKSTASRNARVAELLDLGFGKAPRRAIVQKPALPAYIARSAPDDSDTVVSGIGTTSAGKTLRLVRAVAQSPRPLARPRKTPEPMLIAMREDINAAVLEANAGAAEDVTEPPVFEQTTAPQPETILARAKQAATGPDILEIETAPAPDPVIAAIASALAPAESPRPAAAPLRLALAETPAATPAEMPAETGTVAVAGPTAIPATLPATTETAVTTPAGPNTTPLPEPRPEQVVLVAYSAPEPEVEHLETVTRVSTSGGREWAINVGRFDSRYNAERMLLRTALIELNTLDEALRKVVNRKGGFDANFVGMTHEMAELACRRLQARQTECKVIGP